MIQKPTEHQAFPLTYKQPRTCKYQIKMAYNYTFNPLKKRNKIRKYHTKYTNLLTNILMCNRILPSRTQFLCFSVAPPNISYMAVSVFSWLNNDFFPLVIYTFATLVWKEQLCKLKTTPSKKCCAYKISFLMHKHMGLQWWVGCGFFLFFKSFSYKHSAPMWAAVSSLFLLMKVFSKD